MINELSLGGTVAAEGVVLTGESPEAREMFEVKRTLTGATVLPALKQAALPARMNDMVVGYDRRWCVQDGLQLQRKRYAARSGRQDETELGLARYEAPLC